MMGSVGLAVVVSAVPGCEGGLSVCRTESGCFGGDGACDGSGTGGGCILLGERLLDALLELRQLPLVFPPGPR